VSRFDSLLFFLCVTLAGQNLFVPVPGGTSTFREFSKRRNDIPIYPLC
jgi:hypothetical protein